MSDTVNQGLCIQMMMTRGLLLPLTVVRTKRTCSDAGRNFTLTLTPHECHSARTARYYSWLFHCLLLYYSYYLQYCIDYTVIVEKPNFSAKKTNKFCFAVWFWVFLLHTKYKVYRLLNYLHIARSLWYSQKAVKIFLLYKHKSCCLCLSSGGQ